VRVGKLTGVRGRSYWAGVLIVDDVPVNIPSIFVVVGINPFVSVRHYGYKSACSGYAICRQNAVGGSEGLKLCAFCCETSVEIAPREGVQVVVEMVL
jgi:hypothetical protein